MNPLLRILDANVNRAREGLRVMEDVARFARDDAPLCATIKGLRHDVADACRQVDPTHLVAHRDTPGDVGTAVQGAGEYARASVADVAAAAGARATEALRAIEESLKGLARPDLAARIEGARYKAYDLDRRLRLSLGTGRARQWRVCVLITESLCRLPWLEVARAAIKGGADCLQLREKTLDSGELVRRARSLVEMARPHGCCVIVNDRADVALLAGADGVHVGQTDLAVADVRRLAGSALLVGVSTQNLEQAAAAVRAGADYCGLGPMFPTTTKHKPEIAGPGYVRAYLSDPVLSSVPHLAIGGITPENAAQLALSGCQGVAVSGAVCGSGEPGSVVERLRAGIAGPSSGPNNPRTT